jgi:hypothetical protein
MKPICKIAGAVAVLFVMSVAGIPFVSDNLVPEAQALRGRGAAFAVGAAVGSASTPSTVYVPSTTTVVVDDSAAVKAAEAEAAAAKAQAAAAQQQALAAQQQAALAQQQAAAGQKLPVGTVVTALPAGCTPSQVGGVNYQYCGGNFFQPTFQGSTLVYVTAQPK